MEKDKLSPHRIEYTPKTIGVDLFFLNEWLILNFHVSFQGSLSPQMVNGASNYLIVWTPVTVVIYVDLGVIGL